MKIIYCLIYILIISNLCFAQIFDADRISQYVCNIRTRSVDKDISGTGFLLSVKSKNYLVTASHVANRTENVSYILIQGIDFQPKKYLLDKIKKNNWINHPIADISIIEIDSTYLSRDLLLRTRFLPFSIIYNQNFPISRNIQLTVVGFPLGLGSTRVFSPLTFRTYASSSYIEFKRFDTNTPQEFIILENPSLAGYSGAPVLDLSIYYHGTGFSTGGGTKCIGIIHGTITDSISGAMAAVTPIQYLFDLLK